MRDPAVAITQPTRTPAEAPVSITDFLTDGSLAALCEELSLLTSVPVQLRDTNGGLVTRREGRKEGEPAWQVAKPESTPGLGAGSRSIPLQVAGNTLGTICIGSGAPTLGENARLRLESTLTWLARTATELCQHDLELKHRSKELAALSRMSSLLVRAAGPDRVLEVALDSALDVLGLDAGSVVLISDEAADGLSDREDDLVLKASRNLSADWLGNPLPLSKDRLFDKEAMSGKLVIVENIATDDRINLRDQAGAEGLGAAIHAGLVFQNRPLGVLRLYSRKPRTFDESDRRTVMSLAAQAAAAIEQARLLRFEQEEARIQRQLQLAADVQRRMLPRGVPTLPEFDIAAKYIPSFELGGDFYDFIELNGHLGIVVGDVVGKGIAAALLMSSVRATLRAHVQGIYDIDEVVARVNHALYRDTRDNEFASLWYGVIDPAKLRMTYCSAGHEPPMVVHIPKHRAPNQTDVNELNVGGMVVGIDPSQRYQRAVFDLRPNDVLLAYTDGLVDATNFTGQRFGKKRLRDALLRSLTEKPNGSSADILERILWELRQFSGLAARSDDRTVVVMRVRET